MTTHGPLKCCMPDESRVGVKMTFKEFLAGVKPGFDGRGDFLRLAAIDPRFPASGSWDVVLAYIVGRYGNQGMTDAATDLWRSYQKAQKLAAFKAGPKT
jgi:hypothetical protein